jgi:hypothetical protein
MDNQQTSSPHMSIGSVLCDAAVKGDLERLRALLPLLGRDTDGGVLSSPVESMVDISCSSNQGRGLANGAQEAGPFIEVFTINSPGT